MSKAAFLKLVAVVLFLFWSFPAFSESFLSIQGYPQAKSAVDDYQVQTQVTPIINQTIYDILYPVIGFPAMITAADPEMSFIIRSEDVPAFEYVRITREIGGIHKEFADLIPVSIEKCGEQLYKVQCPVPVILPPARYDLTVKKVGSQLSSVSWNSVFFPEFDINTKFYIWTDPQIEDLQSKTAGDLNYNSGEYPFKSDSVLDFSRQEGVIKTTISQMNSGNPHFITILGDIVFGIDYQREYEDILALLINFEVPVFLVPGNHDGYAKFVDQNNLTTDLDWDGLQYWGRFIGPLNYAFQFNNKVYLMLNTYDGTPQRRAAGDALGIGDNAAVPVTNWGGFLTGNSLSWIGTMINNYDVYGLFSHMMPLGQNANGKYHKDQLFPKNSVLTALDSQEWNIESSEYDSDPADTIFNETQTLNTGVSLASMMTMQSPPPIYFSGHTHVDRIYNFAKGAELVSGSGVYAKDDMKFIMTTTAATSGSNYWGFRPVTIDQAGGVDYNYMCDNGVNCTPASETDKGFQSVPIGNLWTKYTWTESSGEKESIFTGGNGIISTVTADVVNYLPTEEAVILRFFLPSGTGYKVDNPAFYLSDAGISKDFQTMLIIVKGKIAAGTGYDEFLAKNFSKKTETVTISPLTTEDVKPELKYDDRIYDNEPITAKILNGDEFISIVWRRDKIEVASGDTISVKFDDYKELEMIYITYVTKAGFQGSSYIKVTVEPYVEEPDEIQVDEPDEAVLDEDAQPDIDSNDEDTSDEDVQTKKSKKSGCSAIII
ncbi:MAG TPA: metallophosphoesterase [bacterium]|nr:metallophosphoesterase [bacterium]